MPWVNCDEGYDVYSAPSRGVEYCDKHDYVSVYEHISRTSDLNFTLVIQRIVSPLGTAKNLEKPNFKLR